MDPSDSDTDGREENDYDENRWNWNNRNQQEETIDNSDSVSHNSIYPWNKENDGVTTLYRCDANDARGLYIFDSAYKLQHNDQYDIGGAYADNDAGFWFFFTTSSGPGRNYLMNIFVCHRKPGKFSLGISNSNTLTTAIYNNDRVRTLSKELYWQKFSSTQPDEVSYVKTFCFSEDDRVSLLKMILVIPILIDMTPKSILAKDLVQKIKTELEFGEKLLKDQEPDFVLKSKEGKEFQVHKIALAAHSPKLRDLIRADDCTTLSLNIGNSAIELLLQYLYTGVVKDILTQPLEVLLVMAEKFQLVSLTELVKHAMKLSINSENALEIIVIAEKYDYKDVQEIAFRYIARHPEVLDSDAFSEIDNAVVVKKLLRYIHVKASRK